jgi:hypothetical protein
MLNTRSLIISKPDGYYEYCVKIGKMLKNFPEIESNIKKPDAILILSPNNHIETMMNINEY